MPAQSPVVLPDLHTVFGFGVAGNFAGHLEQAGEAADFVAVVAHSHEAPKGIFPWFVPAAGADMPSAGIDVDGHAGADLEPGGVTPVDPHSFEPDAAGIPTFLGTFPLSHDRVVRPEGDDVNLQIEPEVGLLARVDYDAAGAVTALTPEAFGAFNDCSIRRPGAEKISHKKNWGADSKGLSPLLLALDDLSPDGPTAHFRLACFLLRDGELLPYGVDSAVPDYSYYGDQLLDWIVDRLNHQTGAPETPLENVGEYLRAAGRPQQVLIGIGATRYTAVGESTFLQVGDEAIVAVYDASVTSPEALAAAIADGRDGDLERASVLRQAVMTA